MKQCDRCGYKIVGLAKFCRTCEHELEVERKLDSMADSLMTVCNMRDIEDFYATRQKILEGLKNPGRDS